MDPSWADKTQAITSALSVFVTTGGLWAVYVQIRKLRDAVWGETHAKLCDESIELLRFLAEKPESYEYFYENKELEVDQPDRFFILYASEAVAVFLEHLILQRPNLPTRQWDTWERFIKSTLKRSPVTRAFIRAQRHWYSAELVSMLETLETGG